MLPRIDSTDAEIGFRWRTPSGELAHLRDIIALPGAEPDRWLPTHLEALDDALIEFAGRFGQVLGGGRGPAVGEHEHLGAGVRAIDRACLEYADAAAHEVAASLPPDIRAGQILGTAALMSMLARTALGLMGPAPFDGALDSPPMGPVGGTCDLVWVDSAVPAAGARWVVTTTEGARLPATLAMMLFDSSGVNKDAALTEHRDALARVTAGAAGGVPDPLVASGALDWLLYDWLMAHRESADSASIEIKSGNVSDATMIVAAAAASVRLRSRFDPLLAAAIA